MDGTNSSLPQFYELKPDSKLEVEFLDGRKETMILSDFLVLKSMTYPKPKDLILKVAVLDDSLLIKLDND